jgi:hypothetical protein
VRDVARQEHVTRGFAGYHTAYALTLSSSFSLDVTPAGSCDIIGGRPQPGSG